MLYLQFYLDEYQYVLSTRDVVEIVPEIALTPMPKVPGYIKGICNYHGQSVPVIDVCSLFLERPCRRQLSSRIIFIEVNISEGERRIIGLLVEKATETIKADKSSFMSSGIYGPDIPCLGPVMASEKGLVTLMSPQKIFEHVDRDILFP